MLDICTGWLSHACLLFDPDLTHLFFLRPER